MIYQRHLTTIQPLHTFLINPLFNSWIYLIGLNLLNLLSLYKYDPTIKTRFDDVLCGSRSILVLSASNAIQYKNSRHIVII